MPDPQATALLIHGAWAGAWVWDTLTPFLEERGLKVLAPDLPGCGTRLGDPTQASLEHCVFELEKQLDAVEGPLLLVGHSGGGAVATQLAEAVYPQVTGVAYLAGMMLPSGMSFGNLVAEMVGQYPEASGISPFLEWQDDGRVSHVPGPAIRRIFLQDIDEQVAEQIIPRFGPQAEGSRILVPRWTQDRFGRLPRLYIEARRDQSVILPVQRRMQALVPGAEVVSLDTGHVPQLAAPEAVADALAQFSGQPLGLPFS